MAASRFKRKTLGSRSPKKSSRKSSLTRASIKLANACERLERNRRESKVFSTNETQVC